MNCCDDNGRCHGGAGCAARSAGTTVTINTGCATGHTGCTHQCSEGRACTCAPPPAALADMARRLTGRSAGRSAARSASHRPAGRSCDALGVCQGLEPRCDGCISGLQLTSSGISAGASSGIAPAPDGLRLAPGAVEGYRLGFFGTAAQRRELLRWAREALSALAAVGAVAIVIGLLAGLLRGAM